MPLNLDFDTQSKKKLDLNKDTLSKDFFFKPSILTPDEEVKFKKDYSAYAEKTGVSPDPDDPLHYYDYRQLWKDAGGIYPDPEGHLPSKYKREGHPRMVVDGVNTKTGEPEGLVNRLKSFFSGIKKQQPVQEEIRAARPSIYADYIRPTFQTLGIVDFPEKEYLDLPPQPAVEWAKQGFPLAIDPEKMRKEPYKIPLSPQLADLRKRWIKTREDIKKTPAGKYFFEPITLYGDVKSTEFGEDVRNLAGLGLLVAGGVSAIKQVVNTPYFQLQMEKAANSPMLRSILKKQVSPQEIRSVYEKVARGQDLSAAQRKIWDTIEGFGKNFAQAAKHGFEMPRFSLGGRVQPQLMYARLPEPAGMMRFYSGVPVPKNIIQQFNLSPDQIQQIQSGNFLGIAPEVINALVESYPSGTEEGAALRAILSPPFAI